MAISLRLSDEEAELIKNYALMKKLPVSDVIRKAIIEKIEDEYDLKIYYKAIEEYKNNPVTFTHEEVKKMLETDQGV